MVISANSVSFKASANEIKSLENICKNPFQIIDILHNFFYNVIDEKFSFAKLFVYY